MNQIYLLHEKTRSNFKIGSTCNFTNRIGGYITCCDYFDSTTHYIELYDIIESKYNCYQLDWVVQQLSSKYSYPFIKCFNIYFLILLTLKIIFILNPFFNIFIKHKSNFK